FLGRFAVGCLEGDLAAESFFVELKCFLAVAIEMKTGTLSHVASCLCLKSGSRARSGDVSLSRGKSAAGHCSDDEKRFFPCDDRGGQGGFSGLVRVIFIAGEESYERAALMRYLISNRAAQHRIFCFERVQHRKQRRFAGNFEAHFAVHASECSQMRRKYHANH